MSYFCRDPSSTSKREKSNIQAVLKKLRKPYPLEAKTLEQYIYRLEYVLLLSIEQPQNSGKITKIAPGVFTGFQIYFL